MSPYRAVTGAWLDVERTETLANDVFIHRGEIPNWDHWPDIATLGIPNYYSWVYAALMESANQRGDAAAVEAYRAEAEAWLALGTPSANGS